MLPGVGAFADCRRGLAAVPGMEEALRRGRAARGRPFLGICVGMQLMAERGREFETVDGLGWIKGEVGAARAARSVAQNPAYGLERAAIRARRIRVLDGIETGAHAYFVHSYGLSPAAEPATCTADVDYGGPLAAVVGRDNIVGTQFHPEKSQMTGLRLIANFLRWRP